VSQMRIYFFLGNSSAIRDALQIVFLATLMCIPLAINNTQHTCFEQGYETKKIGFDSTMVGNRDTWFKFEHKRPLVRMVIESCACL